MSRFQNGSLLKIKRKNGEQVWAFRWYENAGGSRSYKKRIVGTVAQLPHRRDAERAVSTLRINLNAGVHAPQTVTDLVAHYRKIELVPRTQGRVVDLCERQFPRSLRHPTLGRCKA